MSARIVQIRLSLAAVYLLAVIAAEGLHFHGPIGTRECTVCSAPALIVGGSSDDRGKGLECHASDSGLLDSRDCPACQFQAQKSLLLATLADAGWQPFVDVVSALRPRRPGFFRLPLPPIRAPPASV